MAAWKQEYWNFLTVQRGGDLVNPPAEWERVTMRGASAKAGLRGLTWAETDECSGEFAWVFVPFQVLEGAKMKIDRTSVPTEDMLLMAFSDDFSAFDFKMRYG